MWDLGPGKGPGMRWGRVQGSGPAPWEVRAWPGPDPGFIAPQVYQVYARRPPEEVHALLRALGTDFVILEDSICFERRHRRGCRLRDLLDVANGHVSAGVGWLWGPERGHRPALVWMTQALGRHGLQAPAHGHRPAAGWSGASAHRSCGRFCC